MNGLNDYYACYLRERDKLFAFLGMDVVYLREPIINVTKRSDSGMGGGLQLSQGYKGKDTCFTLTC